jgi:very-short-patch-repair endonuclease
MRWTEKDLAAFQKRQGQPRTAPKPVAIPRQPSQLETLLAAQIASAGLPNPLREYRWHPSRKWRLDFAWPWLQQKYAGVEVQGMVHRIKGRFKRDIEKRAELLLAGWRVLEVDGDSIRDGRAIEWIRKLLA